ncbi:unnamed protein product [Brugia timori]|uniref:Uncharacterized protein n=1 Tax=Brugia timori TaxID=42155 RepID=A0A0R3QZV8_9BILA|nr:unnamed protein product [Brugia timori]
MDLHGQVTEYLICELLKLERLGEWANDHRGGSGRGGKSMRSDVNHGRLGRRNGRSCHDGMAKHVDAVMKRAKDRRIALTNTSELRTVLTNTGRVAQRLTQPISPHKRLKERAGIWMFAKQSEVITEPNMITSSMQRRVPFYQCS